MHPNNQKCALYAHAHYMQSALKDLLPPMILNSAKALIMATKTHKLPDVMTSNAVDSNDTAYFLDIDLAVLGKSWEGYERYAKQVRLEYCHVTTDAFKQGRKAILETFLERNRLYFTDDFYQRYEQQARANLIKEIELGYTV